MRSATRPTSNINPRTRNRIKPRPVQGDGSSFIPHPAFIMTPPDDCRAVSVLAIQRQLTVKAAAETINSAIDRHPVPRHGVRSP